MILESSSKQQKMEDFFSEKYKGLRIALNKLAFDKLIAKLESIRDLKIENNIKANQEFNRYPDEWEFKYNSNEESELLFGNFWYNPQTNTTKMFHPQLVQLQF